MGMKPQVDFPPHEPSTSAPAPLHPSPPGHHYEDDDDDDDDDDADDADDDDYDENC